MKGILLDLLTGLVAAGLLHLFGAYSYGSGGMGTVFLGAALVFVPAGLLRGNSVPTYSGIKALLLISAFVIIFGLILPIPRYYLASLTAIAYGSSLAAIYARRSWTARARNRSLFILGTTFAAVEIASAMGAPMLAVWRTTRTGNVPARDFTVMRLDGTNVDSAEFKGHIAVLYFWASWCPPCREEFPKLEKLYQRYESNPNVVFLAVNANERGESPEGAGRFIENGGYTIPVAFDDQRAAARLRVGVYPSLILFDRSGHIRLVHAGYDASERYVEHLSKEIDRLLAE